jgi:hypothetical protein
MKTPARKSGREFDLSYQHAGWIFDPPGKRLQKLGSFCPV